MNVCASHRDNVTHTLLTEAIGLCYYIECPDANYTTAVITFIYGRTNAVDYISTRIIMYNACPSGTIYCIYVSHHIDIYLVYTCSS